jgi:hypothetical protein
MPQIVVYNSACSVEAIARQAAAAGLSPGTIVRRLAEAAWAAQPDADRSAP